MVKVSRDRECVGDQTTQLKASQVRGRNKRIQMNQEARGRCWYRMEGKMRKLINGIIRKPTGIHEAREIEIDLNTGRRSLRRER